MGVPAVLAGRYERRGILGEGGMGTVYDAWDQRLERAVALKVLRSEIGADTTMRSRFEAEARTAATLLHPNVVAVFDSGEEEDLAFLVMERLPGHTLRHEIAVSALPPDRVRAILLDVLAALSAAHDAGILHRDIKPGNVLFTADGSVKVGDFGIAKSVGLDLTGTGELVGTTAYIAPERLDGHPATPPSDLYAVGVMAYEALTGTKPFDADTPLGLARAIADTTPPPLPPGVDPALAAVVKRAMRKRSEDRYATAAAMAADLASELAPSPPPPPPIEATPEPEPTEVADRTEELPSPVVPPPVVPPPAMPPPIMPPSPVPPVAEEPPPPPSVEEPVEVEPEREREPASKLHVGLVAAAVALVVLVAAVAVAAGRGGSRPKLAAGRGRTAATTTTTIEASPPLADIDPTKLLPAIAKLKTGLELRVFRPTGAPGAKPTPVLEITDVNRLIAGSATPNDTRELYGAHPPVKLSAAAWANRPTANTEVQLYVTKYATPDDASAVRARARYQEEHKLEKLADRIVSPAFTTVASEVFGTIDVIRYFGPQGARSQSGRPAGALVTRYRGSKGQYLFEINARQTAGADRKPTAPVVDPQPSIDELLAAFAERFDAKLNPLRNP